MMETVPVTNHPCVSGCASDNELHESHLSSGCIRYQIDYASLLHDSVEKMRDCFIIQKLFAHCNKSISYRKDCSIGDASADQSDSSIHWRTGRDRNDC
jgi:hypothetical protein